VGNANALIAVVDDEGSVRTMLRRVLRVADYEVATFPSGEEFMASLPIALPACVILDVHMPGLSGFDVQRRLRAAGVRVPVVMITASDDSSLGGAAKAAGASCLLHKPFSSQALLDALDDAVVGQSDRT
jgi:FixJ family two-component response regulator